jgi:hypothetical protein
MVWLYVALAAVVVALMGYWMFYMIVKWILSDAPPGTSFMGISNDSGPKDSSRR